MPDILLIGYGNPGRLDDGLGPALAEALSGSGVDADIDSDYQLTVEDALAVSQHKVIIFVDAAAQGSEPFYFKRLVSENNISFSSHSISPAALIGLAEELFHVKVDGYILGIRGYCFNEYEEKLSEKAVKNLNAAIEFISDVIEKKQFIEVGTDISFSKTNYL